MLAVSHEDRLAARVDWTSYMLGACARRAVVPGSQLLILNPVGAQRAGNPANLGCFDSRGQLAWVLPVDRARLTVRQDHTGELHPLFGAFWDRVPETDGAESVTVWEAGHPVGNIGVELGANGTRPYGHPWASLFRLSQDLRVVVAVSARAAKEKSYQAYIDAPSVCDLDGRRLTAKNGVLNPEDGAAELAHFAVLNPDAEGWRPVGRLASGTATARGHAHVLRRFSRVWPQRSADEVRYVCDPTGLANDQCDRCAGRV